MKSFLKKKYVLVAIGVVLAMSCVQLLTAIKTPGDEATARAVASLLARAAISEDDLDHAMSIPGVRDVYVTNEDGVVILPARRSGSVGDVQGSNSGVAAVSYSVGDGQDVIVSAHEQLPQPTSPIVVFLILAIGGAVLIVRAHKKARVVRADDSSSADDVRVFDGISLDLASTAAGAALIRLDCGCRVVAVSQQARDEFGAVSQCSHLMDVLDPHEVQPMLQLIRRADRGNPVFEDVCWKGVPTHVSVMKDVKGFLIKISRRCCGE